jgi:hypothetical protein
MDSLLDKMDCLSVASLTSKVLLYTAWLSNPKDTFLSPTQSKEELSIILRDYLKINLKLTELPTLIRSDELPLIIKIKPFVTEMPPEAKPNLLLAVASFFRYKKLQPDIAALDCLNVYDIIMPRKPLKALISSMDEFVTFAYRPYEESPLFIDRVSSYTTNPGAIGVIFGERMVNAPSTPLKRVYGVFDVQIAKLKLLVTAEIDAIDERGNPVELKSKPLWAKPLPNRLLQNWAQCAIANIGTVVTGEFTTQRGVRNSAVQFETSNNVKYQSLAQYASSLNRKEEAIANAEQVLSKILDECTRVGTVYRVSGSSTCVNIEVLKGQDFPISKEMIETLAELSQ